MRSMCRASVAAVILAAGQGTRMKSAVPKVLHKVGGKAIELPAGSYKVEIATTPPRVFEGVAVKEKEVMHV